MNRLRALHDAGVSIWLDTLSRELLDSGDFARLIADCAVTGATSNPTIFAAAITGSTRYDGQLGAAAPAGVHDAQALFFALALDDVTRAADLLRPAYAASAGPDGFVSFERTPDLADDTDIDLAELTSQLEREGVQAFCAPYHQLLDCIQTRLERITDAPAPVADRDGVPVQALA